MNKFLRVSALLFAFALGMGGMGFAAADGEKKEEPPYKFEIRKTIPHTPVSNQGRSGTCWSFGTSSFFEAELMRLGRGDFDLSEMFVVRNVYSAKAQPCVRYHGAMRFGEGSIPRDWIETAHRAGVVPERVYDGKRIGKKGHDHSELSEILTAMLKALNERKELTPRWKEAYEAVLDVYLGPLPQSFEHEGRTHTPKSFFDEVLKLDLSAYVELTSYTHHPFYGQMVLEIPDNWARYGHYYNIPIDELERTAFSALDNGYGVCWDADVSEPTFFRQGYAIIPEKDWQDATEEERQEIRKTHVREKEITQEMRQWTFDNRTTTDDHLMHMVGLAADQTGAPFAYVKNSWGTESGKEGYLFASRSYFRLKTLAILVHRDAIPPDIRKRLGL